MTRIPDAGCTATPIVGVDDVHADVSLAVTSSVVHGTRGSRRSSVMQSRMERLPSKVVPAGHGNPIKITRSRERAPLEV